MNSSPGSTRNEPSQITRRGFLALTAGGAAALLAGCGTGQGPGAQSGAGVGGYSGGGYHGPPITLSYWNGFTGGDGPSMDKLVKAFNQAHKNIRIEQNTMEWADFDQKLPAAAQAGKGPDVAAMHLSSIATYAAQGVIVPLDDLANALGLHESDFVSAVWRGGIYQGKRYGIPLDVHCLGIYWNKEHFKKAGITAPPKDAASLASACQKLQAAGFSQPFWRPNQWPAQLTFMSLIYQNGGQVIASDGTKALFDSQAGVKGISWMLEAIKKGYSPTNVDLDAQYLAFKNGKNSITFDGIWQINDLKAAGVPFGLSPLPTIGDTPAVWADSHEFVMTGRAAQDKNRANAVKEFIGWMSKQSAPWSGAGMIPARNSARQEPAFTSSTQSVFADYLDNLHFLPPVPGWTFVEPTTMDTAVSDIILGKASPSSGLTQAADNATKMMQENLKKYQG